MNGLPQKFKLKLKGEFVGYEEWRHEGIPHSQHEEARDKNILVLYQSKDGVNWGNRVFPNSQKACVFPILHDEKCQSTGFNAKNGEVYLGDRLVHLQNGFIYNVGFDPAIGIFATNEDILHRSRCNVFQNMELVK
jgi:hypothetical protein